MAQITEAELNKRLNKNGWMWHLISNATPGIIRIQLADDGEEETDWRKCIEAPTLDEAVRDAEAFVGSINAYEYGKSQKPMFYGLTDTFSDCDHEWEKDPTDYDSEICRLCGDRKN